MTSKLTSLLTAAAVAGGLAFASTVFAQGTPPTPTPPAPPPPAEQGAHGMMKGEGMNGSGMMMGRGGMGTMMPMMAEMTRMMENCNRMMEGSNVNRGPAGGTGNSPPSDQKG